MLDCWIHKASKQFADEVRASKVSVRIVSSIASSPCAAAESIASITSRSTLNTRLQAGRLLHIDVLDRVILGRATPDRTRDFVSLRELGYFY